MYDLSLSTITKKYIRLFSLLFYKLFEPWEKWMKRLKGWKILVIKANGKELGGEGHIKESQKIMI